MAAWLRALPEWPSHPVNATGTVSAHFGPTLLSEHDCVLHFARFLADAGVPWEDLHLELSPGQWMYEAQSAAKPKRIDLAIMPPDQLAAVTLPAATGALPLDAVFEFALASNYWQHGAGSPRPMLSKVDTDVAKVAGYLRCGLATRGYVIVVEEADRCSSAARRNGTYSDRPPRAAPIASPEPQVSMTSTTSASGSPPECSWC